MKNILIVSGHDNLNISVANKAMIEELKKEFPNAEVDRLDEFGFNIDIKAEQKKLVKADIIVFQFPVYWYSCPAILQNWFEKVLEHGFAYGSQGNALEGKKVIVSCTVGAGYEDYTKEGSEHHTLDEFISNSMTSLCQLCQLQYCGLIGTYGVINFYDGNKERSENSIKIAKEQSKKLIDKIKDLL